MRALLITIWGLCIFLAGVVLADTQTPQNTVQLADFLRPEMTASKPKQQAETPTASLNPNMINQNIIRNTPGLNFLNHDIVYKEVSTPINAINPSKAKGNNAYYPGLRGPNELIIYTPEYGLRTGTNEYGTEAIDFLAGTKLGKYAVGIQLAQFHRIYV